MHRTEIPADSLAVLRRGAAIPAHLLALDAQGKVLASGRGTYFTAPPKG